MAKETHTQSTSAQLLVIYLLILFPVGWAFFWATPYVTMMGRSRIPSTYSHLKSKTTDSTSPPFQRYLDLSQVQHFPYPIFYNEQFPDTNLKVLTWHMHTNNIPSKSCNRRFSISSWYGAYVFIYRKLPTAFPNSSLALHMALHCAVNFI